MWSVNANGFGIFLINAHVSNSFNDMKKHLVVRYKLLFIWHYLKDNVDIYAYQQLINGSLCENILIIWYEDDIFSFST